MTPAPARRAGFSLIEAIVALTIAAITLTVIFELQIQMVRGQERAAAVIDQVAAQENAIALMRDINPMLQPEGTITLPEGDTIRWTSQPYGTPERTTGFPTGDGQYTAQLFAMTVTIERPGQPQPRPLQFDRVGWTR